jgi:tetratricopeptide (TPR) repeat protein
VVEHTGWVEHLAFRRDGRRVLSKAGLHRAGTETSKGWNPFTGELDSALAGIPIETLPSEFVPGSHYLQDSVTSPDGKLAALTTVQNERGGASRSKEYSGSTVVIRELASAKVVQTLTGHSAEVVSLAFSPDGRRLATASFDRTIKLWDTQTGQDVFTLRGHTSGVVSVAFSPNGDQIVSGGIDSTARVWDATPLPSKAIAEHDIRFRKKVETLMQLKATTDDAQRAEILAGSGQWGMACAAYAKAIDRAPGDLLLRYHHIIALAENRDRSGVRVACANLPRTLIKDADMFQVMRFDGFCRLGPDAVDDRKKCDALRALLTGNTFWHNILVQNGCADLAAVAFGKDIKLRPENDWLRVLYALSLLEADDLVGYRRAAAEALSRVGQTTNAREVNAATWVCVLAPDAGVDHDALVRLAEAGVAGSPKGQKGPALNTLGAALYRAGRTDEAIVRLDESTKTSGGVGVPEDWAFLSMAHHRRGEQAEARRWLDKLRSSEQRNVSAPFSWNSVQIGILRREAELLLREKPPARP